LKKTRITKDELKRYHEKFLRFAKASKEEKLVLMRDDAVLFAYALFRGRQGDRLKLYPFQDLILNDVTKLIALAIARQSGKSVSAVIKAFHHIYYNDNSTVLVISKTLKQSIELIDKLRALVNNSPARVAIKERMGSVDNRSEFSMKNAGKETYSRILSVPATDAARGFTADLVIADEIAFWDNSVEMFNEAILPTISESDGSIIMMSTPKGKIGVFYEVFNKDNWNSYQFDWTFCPHHKKEKMDVWKDQIGSFAFRQEYEASFVANQSAYFREKEIRDAVDEDIDLGGITAFPVVLGVDFGKVNDHSVVTIGYVENPESEYDDYRVVICEIKVFPLGTSYKEVVNGIVALNNKYSVLNILYDSTGVGEGPGDFMKDMALPVEPITFSIVSKKNFYSNLKLLFEKRRLRIPKVRELIDELLFFEYEYTDGGNLKLHHPVGGHDDFCDSLALCVYGLKRPGLVTPGLTVL